VGTGKNKLYGIGNQLTVAYSADAFLLLNRRVSWMFTIAPPWVRGPTERYVYSLLEFPYSALTTPHHPFQPASIIVVRIASGWDDPDLVRDLLALRRLNLRSTVAVQLGDNTIMNYQLAAACAGANIRVFVGTSVDLGSLRQQITSTAQFGVAVADWLILRGHTLSPLVGSFVTAALADRDSRPATSGIASRTLRRALDAAELPPPGKLLQILRSLIVAMALQRTPFVPISEIAERYGFWDAAAMRYRFRMVFGVPPAHVRERIGWSYLLENALKRAAGRRPYKMRAGGTEGDNQVA
jgi:AraC-like DNA-binding protein